MNSFSFVILYVANVAKSVAFYADLLDWKLVDQSPTFAMFAQPNGQMLGLWSKSEIAPNNAHPGGGAEYSLTTSTDEAVQSTYDKWKAKGIAMVHPPKNMDFGFTFMATDPDGHFIRVFAPAPR